MRPQRVLLAGLALLSVCIVAGGTALAWVRRDGTKDKKSGNAAARFSTLVKLAAAMLLLALGACTHVALEEAFREVGFDAMLRSGFAHVARAAPMLLACALTFLIGLGVGAAAWHAAGRATLASRAPRK